MQPFRINLYKIIFLFSLCLFSACDQNSNKQQEKQFIAPGAPGATPYWSFSGKTGIGTSYEAYKDKHYSSDAETGEVSKVWFSIAKGVLTETMWGLIHEAQIKDMQLIVVGEDFYDEEIKDTEAKIEYLSHDDSGNPNALAYKITTTDKDGLYSIEKHIFTHPDKQALFVRIYFRVNEAAKDQNIHAYLALNPHIANTGIDDAAEITDYGFHSWEGSTHLSLASSLVFTEKTVGFVGESDGLKELQADKKLSHHYASTGEEGGNVMLLARLPAIHSSEALDIAIGFGSEHLASRSAAEETLADGYESTLAKYIGQGDYIGWQDYLSSLQGLQEIKTSATDGGALLNVSALVLKAQEDKTYAGALIASLSNPWGDTVVADRSSTGYKAVWPRDFYQCAMALLALGDTQTPRVAFEYLKQVQVSDKTPGNKGASGWFLQKTHVNGDLEWVAVQLDQTAMPIMLGWKLWQSAVLNDEDIAHWYNSMLKPAADFLVDGGQVELDWNKSKVKPPFTQQERWEEQEGYSPSSTAASIAGLISAADMAKAVGDAESAERYKRTAINYANMIEATMFTTTGKFTKENSSAGDGNYYLRITQNTDPNDKGTLQDRNGRGELNEYEILDGGFLELVRYGVRAANDEHIVKSLPEYDDTSIDHELRVKYEFTFDDSDAIYPGWRRYGDDGYGEDATTGGNYGADGKMHAGQRGRVWPFFTGERGHYELAAALLKDQQEQAAALTKIQNTYIKGLEQFANQGLMLPEQVWDGVGAATTHQYKMGEGTNSATPLAWTHAEYVKLVRSVHDHKVWDNYPIVSEILNND